MSATVKIGSDGVWECRAYLGKAADGKAIRPFKRFPEAETREQAQIMADAWVARITANGLVSSTNLADLLDSYVDIIKANGASPNTVKTYRQFVRCYVRTYLSDAIAPDMGVYDFNKFEHRLLLPKETGGAGLCRNTVINVHNFLRGAFNFFVDSGIVPANPMIYVSKPSPEKHEASAINEWDFEEVYAKLISAFDEANSTRDYKKAAFAFAAWLALVTGMRCGEVCAERRIDVNRAQLYMHVGGTVIEEIGKKPYRRDVTKGHRCRNVAITEEDLEIIDRFLATQSRFLGRLSADAPLVTLNGSFARPKSVSRAFSRIRNECGLPKEITFHSLRHTHASWLIANGCDIKTLSERLGHADVETTLRFYGHLMPGRDAIAASIFAQARKRAVGVSQS